MVLGGWVVGCGKGEGRALQALPLTLALTLTPTLTPTLTLTPPAATLFLVLFFFIAAFALPPSKFELKAGTATAFK